MEDMFSVVATGNSDVATVIDMDSTSLTSEQEVDSGVESTNSGDTMVYLRISVPELNSQKCLQFHPDDTVWLAKQQILSSLAKTLKDGFNYGLFCPPMLGRSGKFLDEERPLREYPLPGPIGYLEFKFKRRIYKQMQVNPKKMKQIHVKANLKQMIDAVKKGDTNKVTKFTSSGLDPNFNDRDTGETPLTLASMMSHPVEMVVALVSGGAHLDFRNKKGLTPLHTASQKGNEDALRVLLDLGASTNYRDSHGLTPLYHAVCSNASARCVEILLYEHALLGISDEYGWTEVHQASKAGNVQHLEQLIYYGADINLRNSGGNTPLHVCATNQQEECARVLLFRGAKKDVLNYANQDAFDLAIISGNTQLALMIREFAPEGVVPYKDFPTYSAKRRSRIPASTFSTLQRSRSNPQLHLRPFEVTTLDGSREQSEESAFGAGTSSDRRPNRRRTELAFVSEFMTQAPFLANLPRSLSMSSSGSGQVEEVDLTLHPKSPSLSLTENEQPSLPRTVVLQEGENGFGFILRGAKAPDSGVIHLDFVPTPLLPALQYFEQVERNSPADGAGIQPGDFLLEVNGFDVRAASHDYTVRLIKESDVNLTLTILTLHVTPTLTLSRVRAKSQTAAEILDGLTVRRRNSFDSVRRSGLTELENLDRLLLDYERSDVSDRTSYRGSYNESLSSAEGATDQSSKIASIRSVHGKRLAPAIPQPEHWPENGTAESSGMWKARSAQCLAFSKIDEPEQFSALNQVGASHLSLVNHGSGTWLPSDQFCVRNEKRDYSSLAPRNRPPLPPGKTPRTPPVTTEACLDSSDMSGVASYHIMHSFSIAPEKTTLETVEKMGYVETREMEHDLKSRLNDQHYSTTVQYNNGIAEDAGKFKVPPPPPPLQPPKSLAAQNSTAAGTSSVKVRPAVPRRKSHLRLTSETQESVSTKPAEISADSVDFLTLAETARLHFLHQKSGDLSRATVKVEESEESSLRENRFQPVVDNRNRGCAEFNENPVKGWLCEKPASNKKTAEMSFQEELKNSLSGRCQFGANRKQTITGDFANDFPVRRFAVSCEPVAGTQQKCFEKRNDVTMNLSNSVNRDATRGSLKSLEHDGDASCRTRISDDLISLIIPPPPLFFSNDPVDDACSKSVDHSLIIGNLNLNLATIDLATLAPPPPPGFEDNTPAVIHKIKNDQQVKHAFQSRDSIQDLTRPVVSWSVDEVRSWLESIQMTEHVESFERDQVNGLRLARLGRNELIALGVTQVGQRMTIERAIKKAIMLNP